MSKSMSITPTTNLQIVNHRTPCYKDRTLISPSRADNPMVLRCSLCGAEAEKPAVCLKCNVWFCCSGCARDHRQHCEPDGFKEETKMVKESSERRAECFLYALRLYTQAHAGDEGCCEFAFEEDFLSDGVCSSLRGFRTERARATLIAILTETLHARVRQAFRPRSRSRSASSITANLSRATLCSTLPCSPTSRRNSARR